MEQNKQFVVDSWRLGFEHPADWRVEQSGASIYRVVPSGAPQVELTVERLARPGATTESLLGELVSASAGAPQFKLLKQVVESKNEKRGSAVFQQLRNGQPAVTQVILVPLTDSAYILVTGIVPPADFKNYAKLFHAVATSVKLLAIESADDVEIVFADGPSFAKAPEGKAAPQATQSAAAQPAPPPRKAVEPQRARTIASLAEECAAKWAACPEQGELLAIVGDEEIAKILWAALGAAAKSWLAAPARAFENRTPLQCLRRREWKEQLSALLVRLSAELDNLRDLSQLDGAAPPRGADISAELSFR